MSETEWLLLPEEFHFMFLNGWIVDARAGGLIVGRRHEEGHILMFRPTENLGEYIFAGLVEGGEFIAGVQATAAHHEELEAINNDSAECSAAPELDIDSRIINTRAEPHDKFLIIDAQYIINRNATSRYHRELQRINNLHPNHYGRILEDEAIQALQSR